MGSIISRNRFQKLEETAFITKIEKLNADLMGEKVSKPGEPEKISYGMWMNDACETQKKDTKIIRWIKSILSIILPINLYESIKASKVALNYFEFLKVNQEHLRKGDTFIKAKQVLENLNSRLNGKHARKIEAYLLAIDALKV